MFESLKNINPNKNPAEIRKVVINKEGRFILVNLLESWK